MFSSFLNKNKFIRPIDILVLGYIFIISLILLFFHKTFPYWYVYIIAHILIMNFIFLLIKYTDDSKNKIIKFIRNLYPIILYTFMYEELNNFVHLIHQGWFDNYIYNFEYSILGNHPTVLLDKIKSPMVTEFFKLSYFSYYFLVFVPALYIYFKKSQDALDDYVETISFAFYICYISFILFPIRGPRYELMQFHPEPLVGYIITPIQNFIMKHGSMYGGCMPSSHVAAASVSVFMLWKYERKIFYILFPLLVSLCISTVYCRYHYFSDVLAGLIVFIFSIKIIPLYRKYFIQLKTAKESKEKVPSYSREMDLD
jgi:membrane-associated phospholipid phosphatase